MKILAFAGSSSRNSINRQLANYTAHLFKNGEIELLDINDYEMPMFGVDIEEKIGPQEKAKLFIQRIEKSDFLIISLAEHNGSYSVAFKNILDWSSRIDGKLFQNKPMLLMAASPGLRGGSSVLEIAKNKFPFLGANIKATYSLPNFANNFKTNVGLVNIELKNQLLTIIENL